MKLPRLVRVTLKIIGVVVLAIIIFVASAWIYFHPSFERTNGLVYGQRQGHDLTVDVVRPSKPNGLGVVLMVSGGWKSGAGSFRPWMMSPLLRRGYTVFAVYHISQPEVTVMDIAADMQRAVRYIRHHAKEHGVDPGRLGVTGGSSGGHLSLMLATRGGPGIPDATDPVDTESSTVQAVAIFYPVTDLLNLGKSTENLGDGGPPKSFVKGFGPEATNLAVWKVIGREMSPIFFVNSNLPPTLIYHGDADTLVPLDQSQRFQVEAEKAGRTVKLIVHPGGKHGWLSMLWDIRQFANWFDQYLLPSKN
ncbi:MAG: alpha/beta hydrolase [Verrucomicrobia bacterium]|nr:alpha/beta hydrolase [Verrucomicrobiota bacterium]